MTVIRLPWPDRDLHPNARVHWAKKAKATNKARHYAQAVALEAGVRNVEARQLHIKAIFQPPDKRRRDIDGMLSSIKSYLDGIADVCGVDDSDWHIEIRKDQPVPGGRVVIQIEVAA